MAQPDLITQKILGTDPQVGYGESSVLPYRQRQIDTRGFEAMERAKTRQEDAEAELNKSNETFYNDRIGKLNEYNRLFSGIMEGKRKALVDAGSKAVKEGRRLNADRGFNQMFTEFQALADGTKQIQEEYDNISKADYGTYIDKEKVIGAATKNLGKIAYEANNENVSALQTPIAPDLSDPEFFKTDEFLYDKTKDIKASTQSSDKIVGGGLGQYIEQTQKGYKFSTRDANGNLIPGVDKSIIDYFLTVPSADKDMLNFREVMNNLSDKYVENKALKILEENPIYRNLKEDEVPAELKKLKRQIAFDPNSDYFEGKDNIQENILRAKLNPFQESTEKVDRKTGFKYDKDDGKSGDKDFKFEPTIITQNSKKYNPGSKKSGNKITAPGVLLSKKDKPLVLNVAADRIYDFGKGAQYSKNTDRVPIKATSVGYALTNNADNKILAFDSLDKAIEFINLAPQKQLEQFSLKQFAFGNIEEKKNVEGDTGEDDPYNKYLPTVNRSVAIEYNKEDEVGAQINLLSGGAFNNRELTPDEQRMRDAWDRRMNKTSNIDPNKKPSLYE